MENRKTEILSYLERIIAKLEIKVEMLKERSKQFSYYRLIIFLAGIVSSLILYFVFNTLAFSMSMVVFITIFGIVSKNHNKILESMQKHVIWLEIKKAHQARAALNWDALPNQSPEFHDINFIETDLNLIGDQSLHHLLNTSISSGGKNLLRTWLSDLNPDFNEIHHKQLLIKELIPKTRFRDRLILISTLVSKNNFEGDKLLIWLKEKKSKINLKKLLYTLILLAIINVALITLFFTGVIGYPIWVFTSFVYFGIYIYSYKSIEHIFDESVLMFDELKKLFKIFRFLENNNYAKTYHLKELCADFISKEKPSNQLEGIRRIISFLSFKNNPVLWLIILTLFPIDFYFAYKLEKFKNTITGKLPLWLKTWYKLEALNSLANFAYLNPDYSFPEFSNEKNNEKIVFQSKQIGHPLISPAKKVSNDFSMNSAGEIALITGSNMSGKSTFLRTVGINLCLAYSGGPVNCSYMKTSLFRLFTCIKVSDSVIDGISYFYSEVKRLKQLLDELSEENDKTVFFLIDEIFKGTNNFERLEGSKSYIEYIAGSKGIGIISTHDLELVKLSDDIEHIKNYHFREEVVEGRMKFDYLLHEGPCPTTNALKIMKMEGLPVNVKQIK